VFLRQVFGMPIGPIWEFIYPAGFNAPLGITVLYTVVPWIGVMAAGYGFGLILLREPDERRRLCLRIGLTATGLFIVIATAIEWLRPAGENRLPFLLRVLNQQKYPASQLFLMMTLGPAIVALPLFERARGWIAEVFTTFGRVPMFYYLLHIPLIHALSLIVWRVRDGVIHPEWFAIAPFAQVPPSQRWSLSLLYLVFVMVIALLYVPCRWYATVKARGTSRWTRYI
jgi:hypothetical protein